MCLLQKWNDENVYTTKVKYFPHYNFSLFLCNALLHQSYFQCWLKGQTEENYDLGHLFQYIFSLFIYV